MGKVMYWRRKWLISSNCWKHSTAARCLPSPTHSRAQNWQVILNRASVTQTCLRRACVQVIIYGTWWGRNHRMPCSFCHHLRVYSVWHFQPQQLESKVYARSKRPENTHSWYLHTMLVAYQWEELRGPTGRTPGYVPTGLPSRSVTGRVCWGWINPSAKGKKEFRACLETLGLLLWNS